MLNSKNQQNYNVGLESIRGVHLKMKEEHYEEGGGSRLCGFGISYV